MKKYELTEEKITINGNQTLYRIKALKDFSDVKAGDLGGFVESENNLSQDGNCWIYDNAIVYDSAKILDSAQVFGYACIYGSATISGSSEIYGYARIF